MATGINDHFVDKLLKWHQNVSRPLPWKGETDPYLIWLSEIILQQTRVEYGWQYFEAFKKAFPTVQDLASASEDEVLKLWQGLGYYSRARNLHYSAKYIANELNGKFPHTYQEILKLKGVGPYTASAIASFAFQLPYAVVDGNVYRILSRYYGISEPIDTTRGKKYFTEIANELLDLEQPGAFNQAMMDFGALQCKPAAPKCNECPLQPNCVAYQNNQVEALPVKSKRQQHKHRYFNYLVFDDGEFTYLQKRSNKDIWKNLYEFPLLETNQPPTSFVSLKDSIKSHFYAGDDIELQFSNAKLFNQTLSHQKIHARFFEIPCRSDAKLVGDGLIKVRKDCLDNFAFPRIISWYLSKKNLYSTIIR